MKSSWIIQGPLHPTAILITDKREATNTEEKTVWGQNQTRVMKPQAKECFEPPEARRGKDGFSPRGLEGNAGLLTPWLQTSGPLERIHVYAFRPPQLVVLLCSSPRKRTHRLLRSRRGGQSRGALAKLTWNRICHDRMITSLSEGRGAVLGLSQRPYRGCLVCAWPCPG